MALSVDKALSKAAKHARRGEIGDAAALYREILEKFPANQRAQKGMEALRSAAPAAKPSRAEYEHLVQLYQSGRFQEAVERATLMARRFPDAFIVHNILGLSQAGEENWPQAIASYEQAIRLSPGMAELHNNLGIALQKAERTQDALAAYEKALSLSPGFPDAINNLALLLIENDRYDEAIENLEALLSKQPANAEARKNLATAYADKGRLKYQKGETANASKDFKRALELDPEDGKTYLSYALAKKIEPDDPHLSKMQELAASGRLSGDAAASVEFALAETHFNQGDTENAFDHLHRANAMRLAQLDYKLSHDVERHREIMAYFNEIGPQDIAFEDDLGFTPVFILGMPRSGTTLTEQILGTQPDCFAAGELGILNEFVRQTPWYFDERTPQVFKSVRAQYGAAIREKTQKRFVLDKMPFNFRIIGFIAEAFPEAKIIHMQRSPEAVCWSNYRTFFHAETMGYCFGMAEVAGYYHLYEELMAFWKQRFGARIFDLSYETLTEAPESETRKLFDHVGLQWDASALNFHESTRPVLTASAAQVRKKLYRGSSEAWKKYEAYLAPMIEALAAQKGPVG